MALSEASFRSELAFFSLAADHPINAIFIFYLPVHATPEYRLERMYHCAACREVIERFPAFGSRFEVQIQADTVPLRKRTDGISHEKVDSSGKQTQVHDFVFDRIIRLWCLTMRHNGLDLPTKRSNIELRLRSGILRK
jgi:hypothetical protein